MSFPFRMLFLSSFVYASMAVRHFIKLRDGKIYEYTEYFNPIVMAKAFGIPLGAKKNENQDELGGQTGN